MSELFTYNVQSDRVACVGISEAEHKEAERILALPHKERRGALLSAAKVAGEEAAARDSGSSDEELMEGTHGRIGLLAAAVEEENAEDEEDDDLPTTGWPRACIQRYCSQRPPGGDGAAISGVHRHVGLLQERPGGIGAANGDIEIFPRKCQNQ